MKTDGKEKLLPKHLKAQIERFIGVLESYNRKLPHPRSKRNYPYLLHFFKHFAMDQNNRAFDVSSPAYDKVKEIASKQFPVRTLWNLCIDGRVLSILAHGVTAGVGSSVRVPGGMLREFVRGRDGKLKLAPDSDFAMLLKKAMVESSGVLAEVFDSHIGCAAREAEEQAKGRQPKDKGLLADVSHKMQMAQAAIAFAKETFGDQKKLMVILTSFNPHTGYMYMGLETQDALLYLYKRGNAYTEEMLEGLVEVGKIISTEKLALQEDIRKVFEKHKFILEWRENYVKSARFFWESIAGMKKDVLPIIEKKLLHIYPQLGKTDALEVQERAMLLLTNAFSGYLHNLEKKTKKEKADVQPSHYYPYGIHREQGVKVGEGGHPPYNISMFTVFSFEEQNLPSNIMLATSLVRKNRIEKRIADVSGTFVEQDQFAQACVPIAVSEIVRDKLSENSWQELLAIDWRDLPEDWDAMSEDAFYDYLQYKGVRHFGVAIAINNLRRKLAVMFNMHSPISSRLIEQYKVALPFISSRNRRIRFIIPFVKLGFS